MIQEARYRIAYNKQRAQLRNLLQCVADEPCALALAAS